MHAMSTPTINFTSRWGRRGLTIGAAVLLSACASQPADIAPKAVDAAPYAAMNCDQLKERIANWRGQEAQLVKMVGQRARPSVGIGIGGGSGFGLGLGLGLNQPIGDSGQADELATVRGHLQAAEQQAKAKNCVLSAP